ncbi:kinase-like protein, partial [Aureobasidium melanogenum]
MESHQIIFLSTLSNPPKIQPNYHLPSLPPTSFLILNTIITPKPRISLNPTILNRPKTSHEQRRKPSRKILQISFRQRTHSFLDIRTHILVVVFLVAECTQQIQHFGAVVFALLAEGIQKHSVEIRGSRGAVRVGRGVRARSGQRRRRGSRGVSWVTRRRGGRGLVGRMGGLRGCAPALRLFFLMLSSRICIQPSLSSMRDVAVTIVGGRVLGLRNKLWSLPSAGTSIARRVDQSTDVLGKGLTQAKVRDDQTKFVGLVRFGEGDEDILRLDVAMDNAKIVEMIKSFGKLIECATNVTNVQEMLILLLTVITNDILVMHTLDCHGTTFEFALKHTSSCTSVSNDAIRVNCEVIDLNLARHVGALGCVDTDDIHAINLGKRLWNRCGESTVAFLVTVALAVRTTTLLGFELFLLLFRFSASSDATSLSASAGAGVEARVQGSGPYDQQLRLESANGEDLALFLAHRMKRVYTNQVCSLLGRIESAYRKSVSLGVAYGIGSTISDTGPMGCGRMTSEASRISSSSDRVAETVSFPVVNSDHATIVLSVYIFVTVVGSPLEVADGADRIAGQFVCNGDGVFCSAQDHRLGGSSGRWRKCVDTEFLHTSLWLRRVDVEAAILRRFNDPDEAVSIMGLSASISHLGAPVLRSLAYSFPSTVARRMISSTCQSCRDRAGCREERPPDEADDRAGGALTAGVDCGVFKVFVGGSQFWRRARITERRAFADVVGIVGGLLLLSTLSSIGRGGKVGVWGPQCLLAPMRDAREEKESMVGWMNDGRGGEFDQGYARRVRGCGWLLFVGCCGDDDDFRAFRVATVGS